MSKHYSKYGGVHFVNNVSPEEINRFVNSLSDEEHCALYTMITLLREEGLISLIDDDITTIDHSAEEFLVPNAGDELK